MNREQILGITREALAAVAALLITFGVTSLSRESGADGETIAQLAIGAILAIVSLACSLAAHDDATISASLFRKALSALAGFLTGVGWLSPEKAEALFGLIVALLPIGWSIYSKGKIPSPPAGTSLAMALLVAALAIGSIACSPSVIIGAATGAPIPTAEVVRKDRPDGQSISVADTDLILAERKAAAADEAGDTRPANGLFDAGAAADRAREVFTGSSK